MYLDVGTAERRAVFLENRAAAERNRMRAEREARGEPPVEDVVDEAATARRLPPPRPSKVRSIHWSPYDRVGVVNAIP